MKKSNSFLLTIAGILLISTAFNYSCNNGSGSAPALSADTLLLADARMKSHVDKGELPCVATLILKDGQEVHRLTYGMANIEEEKPLAEDAIFRIYSMSKPVTAAALMILYDEGKFKLDDPVASYIPAFEETRVYVEGELVDQDQPMTIRHLLTHTAGLTYGWGEGYVDSLYRVAQGQGFMGGSTLADMVNILAGLPLKFQPGTTYEYSVALDVTGYLVEVLSGMPFDVFLKTRIFDPLGMVDTGFEVPEKDFDRLAMVYTKNQESGKLTPVPDMTNGVKKKVTLFSGGGGLVSTLSDYGKFGQMLLNGGTLNGKRILQGSTVDLIMSDQMPEAVPYDGGYGLGGYVDLETGAYGWSGAASTDFVANPSNQMVVLSFTQYIPFMGVPFADEYKKLVWNAVLVKTE